MLTVVDDADESLHLNELAELLVKQGETVMDEDEYADAVERQRISLHHNVLPRLTRHGLVEYDPDSHIVSIGEDERAEIDWLRTDSITEVLPNIYSDRPANSDAIGILHGRETAIEYGRTLADEAEDELFCMYVSTELLEDDCLVHARDAIARGVEMCVGSRNEEVRTLTRRHVPEATIWEPQRGWVNAPYGYPKIGRLVLVDRQKVMLAILEESHAEGEDPHEKVLVGAGEDNPLVVLVRELLGPRLDHLDRQSTDFRSHLHT